MAAALRSDMDEEAAKGENACGYRETAKKSDGFLPSSSSS
jgi:hypothetical protein